MKKLFTTIVLILTFSINIFGVAASKVNAQGILQEKEQTLLNVLGVINESYELDDKLTKAQFAGMLAQVAFSIEPNLTVKKPGFEIQDVDVFTENADAINTLFAYDYIELDEFGRFFPEKEITVDEAILMMVKVMGYKPYIYENSFLNAEKIAASKDIRDGINIDRNGVLNVYSAYKMICNMLYADISDLYINTQDKVRYMDKRLSLYEIKGVVTDDGIIAQNGVSNILNEQIKINEQIFINKCEYKDLFGCNVVGFYTNDGTDDVLLAVCENTRKNEVITIHSKNLLEFKDRKYHYVEDEVVGKEKTIKIPIETSIIYNEKAITLDDNITTEMMVPENGRVRLYDNDDDGKIDIVRIENFSVGLVNIADNDSMTIYMDKGEILNLEDKEYTIEDATGKNIAFSDIKKGNVISYTESLDGKYVKIIVSDTTKIDRVLSISTGEGYLITESGGKYELLDTAQEEYGEIKVGKIYCFYFDAFDMVAAYKVDKSEDVEQFGYIIRCFLDDEGDETVNAKMFTTDDEVVEYKFAKRVEIIFEDDKENKVNSSDIPNILTYRGLVRYKTNYKDEIIHVEIPHAYGTKPTTEDRLFCMVDSATNPDSAKDYFLRVTNGVANYGGEAIIDGNTYVMKIGDNDKYSMETASTQFSNGQTYSMYVYGTDYKSKKSVFAVVDTRGNGGSSVITDEYAYTVKDISIVYDEEDDEVCRQITLINMYVGESVYKIDDELFENGIFAFAAGSTDPIKLEVGDVVYKASRNDEITNLVVIYDMDQIVKDEKGNNIKGAIAGTELSYYSSTNTLCSPFSAGAYRSGNSGNAGSWKFYNSDIRVFAGWVYAYEDGYIQITNQNPAYGYSYDVTKDNGFITQAFPCDPNRTNVTFKNRKVQVKMGQLSDIKPYLEYGANCSRVVITQRLYDMRSINIINID